MQIRKVSFNIISLLIAIFIFGCSGNRENIPKGLERFGQVHQLLNNHVDQGLIAGASALVIHNGDIVYRDQVGWMNVENQNAMADNTIFRVASMTKAVTTVAVMMLQEEGLLNLSDPVSKFIPAFSNPDVVVEWETNANGSVSALTEPAMREITIHDLLSHTSGLTYSFMGDQNFASLYQEAGVSDGLVQTDLTLAQFVGRLAPLPLKHHPGAAWQYSVSHDVLGRVVEVVSGETLPNFFQKRIFEPLELIDTHFYLPEEKRGRLATLYTIDPDKSLVPAGEEPIQLGALILSSSFHYSGPKKYHSGGAGLVSTVSDYARFLQMLLNNGELDGTRLLKSGSVELMTQNQIGSLNIIPFTGHGDKYGYGFGVLTEEGKSDDLASIGTYSWGGIFNTYYWVDPQKKIIGIIMTQLFPYDHLTLRNDFKEAIYKGIKD